MLFISTNVSISDEELDITAIRAQGSGGQNVNKVSTAIHLRFDISMSSLPERYKQRLMELKDQRVNKNGIIIIKAQRYRSQEKNKEDALQRLKALIIKAVSVHKNRQATKPTKSSQKRRVDSKVQRGKTKALRGKIET